MRKKVAIIIVMLLWAIFCVFGGLALSLVDVKRRVVHFSFDDVSLCLNNIKTNNYTSIFEEPFLKELKLMHEKYGACFSLYVYGGALENQPTKYKAEWQECSSWLKFGLHYTDEEGYAQKSYEDGFNDWNNFAENIYKMSESYSLIDRVVRLHYFDGSTQAIKGMREAKNGPIGFLCADDTRISYSLTPKEAREVKNKEYIKKDDLFFVSTDIRCESIKEEFLWGIEKKFKESGPNIFVVFTHEWQVYDGNKLTTNSFWIDNVCRFFSEKEIGFCFLAEYKYF